MKTAVLESPAAGAQTPLGALPAERPLPAAAEASAPGLARDLVALTKPRVISLLLVTTVVPMLITPEGLPSGWIVLWTLLGGYLMAGGANAINMWVDRDIDGAMGRTRRRPIPAGRMRPAAGLAFGVLLAAAAFGLLWVGANLLAAALALGGLLVYVFVYTLALKRASPQNIVIGGAAGAFPPLVGWAAATGRVDLTAVLLFAIVFYWTPPHFWALALLKRQDYATAGVPMLPVVAGERTTTLQILLYATILVPLTLLPTATGALGGLYAAAALALGAHLLRLCVALLRTRETSHAAWRLYKFSLLYLALLFAAMVADRLFLA